MTLVKFNADGIGVIVIDDGNDKFAGNVVDADDWVVVEAVASSNLSDLTMSLCIRSKCLPMCIFCLALYAQNGHWNWATFVNETKETGRDTQNWIRNFIKVWSTVTLLLYFAYISLETI